MYSRLFVVFRFLGLRVGGRHRNCWISSTTLKRIYQGTIGSMYLIRGIH